MPNCKSKQALHYLSFLCQVFHQSSKTITNTECKEILQGKVSMQLADSVLRAHSDFTTICLRFCSYHIPNHCVETIWWNSLIQAKCKKKKLKKLHFHYWRKEPVHPGQGHPSSLSQIPGWGWLQALLSNHLNNWLCSSPNLMTPKKERGPWGSSTSGWDFCSFNKSKYILFLRIIFIQ